MTVRVLIADDQEIIRRTGVETTAPTIRNAPTAFGPRSRHGTQV
jgi:hypothetical protein